MYRLPETNEDVLKDTKEWPDCDEDTWCYLAIEEATNSHDHEERGIYESWIWIKLNGSADWSIYES